MAGRYIPPHMRGSTGSSSAEKPMVKAERKPEDGYTLEEIANQFSFDHKKKLGTLNRASISVEEEETPNLGLVIVFKDQHPEWPPKIFCKTYLFLLPKTETLPSTPITVFTEISNLRTSENQYHHEQRFLYAGAHTITRIQYLMPRSPLLVKMLESKFTGPKNERSEEAWNKSLNMKWAVVDLSKVEEEEQGISPMEPLKEIKKKSVSEMLEEMRLRESSGGKENGKPGGGDDREEALHGDEDR
ncbi:hypothetical protein HO173_004728 [Letharia columbiana]|uniref:Uncharacterized protein n=1 Tax=Letharia columbiana TaxID=112416 RepID=A0A8H6FYT0_9LECA|nr:uncharacterized protein HO173_004728 [Letharia columbiana]KAF6237259.1 hypothetical protein HO173_004728 [Letharia columbiana]